MKGNDLGSIQQHQWEEASPGEPPGHTKLGLEEDLLRGLSRRQEPYYGSGSSELGLVEGTRYLFYFARRFASP